MNIGGGRSRRSGKQRQAALGTDALFKHGWQQLGQEWLLLAEQIEWIGRRYDSARIARNDA
jgi:hypothetical protein